MQFHLWPATNQGKRVTCKNAENVKIQKNMPVTYQGSTLTAAD